MSPVAGPSGGTHEFEKVQLDEWINGEIAEVQEKKAVKKQYTDRETGEIQDRVVDQIRFKFKLDGYKYHHYSRWMTKVTGENSNLYKFLLDLYGAILVPNCMVDLDKLKGVKVKTMWDEVVLKSGDMYQFVDKIRPLGQLPNIALDKEEYEAIIGKEITIEQEPHHEEETPF